MNAPAYFEIQADDVPQAAEFYRRVFGWKFTQVEGLPIEYWRIETDGPPGGLLKRPAPMPPAQAGTNSFVCSMQVASFDTTAQVITQAGGKVALPKFAVPGACWQGYFIDPAGNTFGIFQVDERAG